MVDGLALEPGANAALHVEMESKNALAPAPIPLRLMVEHNVLDPTKRHGNVMMAHALVSNWVVKNCLTLKQFTRSKTFRLDQEAPHVICFVSFSLFKTRTLTFFCENRFLHHVSYFGGGSGIIGLGIFMIPVLFYLNDS